MHPDQKNYYWGIAGFYFFYYAFVGMFAPYWSLYLKSIGFDAIDPIMVAAPHGYTKNILN
ncbi:MAG: MFS transporter [Gallionella sp.]|nr:MFS transporter [Gallionella sp.]